MADGWNVNLTWSSIAGYVDGWVPKLSTAVPLVGYVILFNDAITEHLKFENMVGDAGNSWLESDTRLRLIYFGLLSLGLANLAFYAVRPRPQRLAKNEFDYGSYAIDSFTWSEILTIKQNYTVHSEQTDAHRKDWGQLEGQMQNPSRGEKNNSPELSWNKNKRIFEDAIRQVLVTQYVETDSSRALWMMTILVLSTIGYLFLAIPGFEMFFRVLFATF